MKIKSWTLPLILITLVFLLTACTGQAPSAKLEIKDNPPRPVSSATMIKPTDTQKVIAACGRDSAQTYLREAGQTLSTSFFDFTIIAIKTQASYADLALAESDHHFLTAEVVVKNTFAETIPVGNYDFSLVWEGGPANAHLYAAEGMYPDQIDLAPKESLAGTLVFEVPKTAQKCQIVYKEIWDDHYEGSTYAFLCSI